MSNSTTEIVINHPTIKEWKQKVIDAYAPIISFPGQSSETNVRNYLDQAIEDILCYARTIVEHESTKISLQLHTWE